MTTGSSDLGAPVIVLFDDNLFTSSRVASALRASGRQVLVARWVQQVPAATHCEVVLINLGSRSLDGVALIGPLRALFPNILILGFCGHLEIEIRRAAKAAGIDRLLTNEGVSSLEWLAPA